MRATGTHRLEIHYELEAVRHEDGASVSLPLPPAPSVVVSASLPPEAIDGAMVPGIGAHTTRTGGGVLSGRPIACINVIASQAMPRSVAKCVPISWWSG